MFRAKLEEDYSKNLQRLVKNAGGALEIGYGDLKRIIFHEIAEYYIK